MINSNLLKGNLMIIWNPFPYKRTSFELVISIISKMFSLSLCRTKFHTRLNWNIKLCQLPNSHCRANSIPLRDSYYITYPWMQSESLFSFKKQKKSLLKDTKETNKVKNSFRVSFFWKKRLNDLFRLKAIFCYVKKKLWFG